MSAIFIGCAIYGFKAQIVFLLSDCAFRVHSRSTYILLDGRLIATPKTFNGYNTRVEIEC